MAESELDGWGWLSRTAAGISKAKGHLWTDPSLKFRGLRVDAGNAQLFRNESLEERLWSTHYYKGVS